MSTAEALRTYTRKNFLNECFISIKGRMEDIFKSKEHNNNQVFRQVVVLLYVFSLSRFGNAQKSTEFLNLRKAVSKSSMQSLVFPFNSLIPHLNDFFLTLQPISCCCHVFKLFFKLFYSFFQLCIYIFNIFSVKEKYIEYF